MGNDFNTTMMSINFNLNFNLTIQLRLDEKRTSYSDLGGRQNDVLQLFAGLNYIGCMRLHWEQPSNSIQIAVNSPKIDTHGNICTDNN